MPGKKMSIKTDLEKMLPNEMVQEEPVKDLSLQEKILHEETSQKEPVQDELVQDELVQNELLQEEPIQEEPIQEKPVKENPVKEEPVKEEPVQQKRTIKSLVNTPLKRVMFGIQILSYILILGSPAIGGLIGKMLELKTGATAGVILGIFIAGEVLFYGSLAFLGKELILLLKERVSGLFRRKR
jgi:hypothetical protein